MSTASVETLNLLNTNIRFRILINSYIVPSFNDDIIDSSILINCDVIYIIKTKKLLIRNSYNPQIYTKFRNNKQHFET